MPSTAISLATSPARWPPMPSATTNTVGRRGGCPRCPAGRDPCRWPIRPAQRSPAIARTAPPARWADLDAVARVEQLRRRRAGRRCGTCRWSSRGPRPSRWPSSSKMRRWSWRRTCRRRSTIVHAGSRPSVISPAERRTSRRGAAVGSSTTSREAPLPAPGPWPASLRRCVGPGRRPAWPSVSVAEPAGTAGRGAAGMVICWRRVGVRTSLHTAHRTRAKNRYSRPEEDQLEDVEDLVGHVDRMTWATNAPVSVRTPRTGRGWSRS